MRRSRKFGGTKPGSQPIKIVAGLTVRSGAVIGNAGAFRFTQQFNMGGVQFGEPLRGYPEFSITPDGYLPDANSNSAAFNNPGAAFFSSTAEVGVRFNSMFYVNGFFDAGNVYRRVRAVRPDPTLPRHGYRTLNCDTAWAAWAGLGVRHGSH